MTPDERALLSNFLNELANARGGAKDGEAEGMIRQALAANPDATYLLVQHAIVADQSLHAAQARIAELERQVSQPQSSTSFLSPGSGPWGGAAQPSYAPPPPEERPGIFSGGGGLGSFLRTAGTTAAGVAGGEMLFSGLSDLFGGHRASGFGGGQGFMGGPEENVVINNYDDDNADDDRGNW
ncbi:DUF2076 domain-containing protein [Sphingomonas sp. GC_Shp_3]|uniref:DUF2076 domain-containing protein n=1 Tax=Sphingomonas sp. GC_Shp_3 TaxID=2937383 RepID=UPI00226A632C|nr:DUF2076 domain-containing protein [Sphingomonas sp. GC_Shp_3]